MYIDEIAIICLVNEVFKFEYFFCFIEDFSWSENEGSVDFDWDVLLLMDSKELVDAALGKVD